MYKNYRWIFKNCLPSFGGSYGAGANAGAFYLIVNNLATYSSAPLGGRLMLL